MAVSSLQSSLYVGVMSGTSLDGVDAVLADTSTGVPRLLGSHYQAYPTALRGELLALHTAGDNELHRAAVLANVLAEQYAQTVVALLAANGNPRVAAIGCHGQTIRHQPQAGYTIQLVNGALLAERTGISTIIDFRSRDIAAGGQGAPLVPAFHAMVFRQPDTARAIVNIGGIANLTCLPVEGPVSGFDTGPGNLLMDALAGRHQGQTCDKDGSLAAAGCVNENLLAAMLSDPFFQRSPPKSTGRDHFNWSWLEALGIEGLAPSDIQATLAELSARSIVAAVEKYCPQAREVLICGGGVHNIHLMRRLVNLLPSRQLASTAAVGLDPDWVEALAFAWLARCTMEGIPGNAPEVTGATGARILGAIYPQ